MTIYKEVVRAVNADLATYPSDTADGRAAPSDLGRGFLSTLGAPRTLIITPDKAEWEVVVSNPQMTVDLIDDRSSFAKAVSWSANAKFGYGGGSGSIRASMSQKYRRSQQSVDMVLTKVAHTNKCFLRDPEWREEAAELLRRDMPAFVDRYGDKFIRSVTLGGVLSIVYHLDFESVEESEEFRIDADIKYGTASGGASFHSKLLRTATRAAISLEAIASGVRDAPPIFQPSIGVDQNTARVEGNDPLVTALISYFDQFEESVQDTGGIPILFELDEINNAANAPTKPKVDLSPRNLVLDDGAYLDDFIDERRSVVEYMRAVAVSWNPQVTPTEIDDLAQSLANRARNLEQVLSGIANLSSDKVALPFSLSDVEEIPPTWNIRKLTEIKRISKTNESFRKAKWVGEVDLRSVSHGRPIGVDVSAAYVGFPFVGGSAWFTVYFVDDKGDKLSDIVSTRKYSKGAERKMTERISVEKLPEMVAIRVESSVQNARLRVVVVLKS